MPANYFSIPSPVGGLNSISQLTEMPIIDAIELDNWIPYPSTVKTRPGAFLHCTGETLKTLHTYTKGLINKLFATGDTDIFDVTTAGAAVGQSRPWTRGEAISVTFSNAADSWLVLVNGVNVPQLYNTTWASSAYLGVDPTTLFNVTSYRQRLFFASNSKLSFFYGASGAIGGTLTEFPVGAFCKKGGSVLCLNTWTVDLGAGVNDLLVVTTTKGETTVWSGNDPSSPTAWALQGVYELSEPLNARALYKYQGDLLYACTTGLIPLSSIIQSSAIEERSYLSNKIQQTLSDLSINTVNDFRWQVQTLSNIPALLVNVPTTPIRQYLMHTKNKSWCSISGWLADSWAELNNRIYFCNSTGVSVAFEGGSDYGKDIVSTGLCAFQPPTDGVRKTHIKLMRPVVRAQGQYTYRLAVGADFNQPEVFGTVFKKAVTNAAWGAGIFGVDVWGGKSLIKLPWRTVRVKPGSYLANYFQISTRSGTVEWISTDAQISQQGAF